MARMGTSTNGKPKLDEQTFAQTISIIRSIIDADRGIVGADYAANYRTYRTIRKHPTIALARATAIAPVAASRWSYEKDPDAPDEWLAFIRDEIDPHREPLTELVMANQIDYGWSAWEKVFKLAPWKGAKRYRIDKLKNLLVDLTDIIVVTATGAWEGFRQWGYGSLTADATMPIDIYRDAALLFSFRVEGTDWYGEPLLENARKPFLDWQRSNQGAQRYDQKVAGEHWLVHYPPGNTPLNGTPTSNAEVAKALLTALTSTGHCTIPNVLPEGIEEFNQAAPAGWKIELLSSAGQQHSFVDRLDYCDRQMVRALLVPERSVTEGQYGTKAEAGVHRSAALTVREVEHNAIVRAVNGQLIDQLLFLNWGPDAVGKVWATAAPLVDERAAFQQQIVQGLLANPAGFVEMFDALDHDALLDAVGLSKAPDVQGNPAAGGVDALRAMADNMRRLRASVAEPVA